MTIEILSYTPRWRVEFQQIGQLFRDYLRTHPPAAQAYAQVKMALARRDAEDIDFYYDAKDPVCDIIMAGAEGWAAHTGWQLGRVIRSGATTDN